MCYPLPWFPLSDDPSRCIRHTTTVCRPYRASLSICRFGRCGSSGFVGSFHRLRWSSCIPVQRGRSYCIVIVGNNFGQPLGVVAVACGVTDGGDDADEVVKEPIFQTTLGVC